MDPVHPDIDEVAIGEGLATPLVILGPPGGRQARDRGGREPRRVFSEQHWQHPRGSPRSRGHGDTTAATRR